MKSKRVITTFLVVAAALAVGATGCKKSKKGANSTSGKAGTSASASKGSSEASAKKALAILPKTSEMVMGINVAQFRGSPLWKEYMAYAKAHAKSSDLSLMETSCGVDLISHVGSVVIGGNSANEKLLGIINGLDRAKVKACVPQAKTKDGKKVTVTTTGEFDKFVHGTDTALAGWLGSTAVVAMGDKTHKLDQSWLKTRMAGKDGLDTNQQFTKLLANVDTSATIWFGVIPTPGSPMSMSMGMMGGTKPTAVYGSMMLDSGVKVNVGIRFANAAAAKKMVTQAEQMMAMFKSNPQFGKYVAKVKLSTKDSDAIVKVDLSQQDLTDLEKTLQSTFGAYMQAASAVHPPSK